MDFQTVVIPLPFIRVKNPFSIRGKDFFFSSLSKFSKEGKGITNRHRRKSSVRKPKITDEEEKKDKYVVKLKESRSNL